MPQRCPQGFNWSQIHPSRLSTRSFGTCATNLLLIELHCFLVFSKQMCIGAEAASCLLHKQNAACESFGEAMLAGAEKTQNV